MLAQVLTQVMYPTPQPQGLGATGKAFLAGAMLALGMVSLLATLKVRAATTHGEIIFAFMYLIEAVLIVYGGIQLILLFS